MNIKDVPATEVVQPGSRISYRLLLAGDEENLEVLKGALPLEPNFRWVSIRESSPRIGSALDRAESFLLLGGLLGVLLAGIAVALSAHRYAARHYDHVGVLKTLGATPRQILFGFLSIMLLVGSVAICGGLLVGGGLHLLIVELLSGIYPGGFAQPGDSTACVGCRHRADLCIIVCYACLCASQRCISDAGDSSRSRGASGELVVVLRRCVDGQRVVAHLVQPKFIADVLDFDWCGCGGARVWYVVLCAVEERGASWVCRRAAVGGWRSVVCKDAAGKIPFRYSFLVSQSCSYWCWCYCEPR